MMAGQDEAGFTLFEVLAALAISSLVMTALGAAMATINRGQAQASVAMARQAGIAGGLAILSGDIQHIERAAGGFAGRADGMEYVLAERRGEGLFRIRLAVREGNGGAVLLRSRAPFAGGPYGDEVELLSGDYTLAFSYRAPRGGGREWSAAWPGAGPMPDEVRLEISDLATGRLRAPVFVEALRITAEAAK